MRSRFKRTDGNRTTQCHDKLKYVFENVVYEDQRHFEKKRYFPNYV
jgi:hypothetical protein